MMAGLAITIPNATAVPFFARGHEARTTKMVALSVEPMLPVGTSIWLFRASSSVENTQRASAW